MGEGGVGRDHYCAYRVPINPVFSLIVLSPLPKPGVSKSQVSPRSVGQISSLLCMSV